MRQHLLIDADDTLWETQPHFDTAVRDFIDLLNHSSLSPEQIKSVLDEIESATIKVNGYGTINFARNLQECYRRLCDRAIDPGDLDKVLSFGERILSEPIELIDGVEDTVMYLCERHDLILMTKGCPEEQALKFDRSGLRPYFTHTRIVREKNVDTYRTVVADLNLDPDLTWMIGNSPRSDINPALGAGLGAVHVPRPALWSLEHEEIAHGSARLIVAERFKDLMTHF